MKRKDFIKKTILYGGLLAAPNILLAKNEKKYSRFSKRLKPVGRALELEDYYVWCNSPIYGPDGKVHVFFSRWDAKKKMSGWINGSEIAHAVADSAESSFSVNGTILSPRPGFWDATTCHNPFITSFNGKYYLYYIGNSNGKTNTKRIGVAVAGSLDGPWVRSDQPILLPGADGAWDDHCTTNPAVIFHSNKYWLYYKSWNTKEYETATGTVRGNRKYGLAFADHPEGPFSKYTGNPVVDFSKHGNNAQIEDAYVWFEKRRFNIIARDMGYFDHQSGLLLQSRDGIHWGKPEIAYENVDKYIQQPPAPKHLTKYGRFERPQLLLENGKPTHLFCTSQGGKYITSSSFIFRVD